MGYLKVDEMGRVYESSSDHADGSGFKTYAHDAEYGDVTHGAVYLKSAKAQAHEIAKERKTIQVQDKMDTFSKMKQSADKIRKTRIEKAQNELQNNEQYQKNLLRKALKEDSNKELTHRGSSQLSANGQLGYEGMTRDQKAIHQHMGTMGVGQKSATFSVSALEKQQAFLNSQAEKQIHADAVKQAKRNDSEYKASKTTQSISEGKKAYVSSNPIFPSFALSLGK